MSTIAIITARGGSRRLPRKNIKPMLNHPLVAWAIMQAKTSHLIDEVYVSTDDDEIEEISKKYGAKVIRRPEWPDANEASAIRPIAHAIEVIQAEHSDFSEMVAILPTNPLNRPGDFDKAIQLFREYGCDSIIPLRPIREMMLYKKVNGLKARQTLLDKHYGYLGEAGAWVVTTPKNYLAMAKSLESDLDSEIDKNSEAGKDPPSNYYMVVEYWQYADVDTNAEFELCELLLDHYIAKGRGMEPYVEYLRSKNV